MELPFFQTMLRTIRASNDTAFLVTVKNEVYALGRNTEGQLCVPP